MEHIKTIQFHQVKSNAKNIFLGFVAGLGMFVGIWSIYTYVFDVFEWIRNLIK